MLGTVYTVVNEADTLIKRAQFKPFSNYLRPLYYLLMFNQCDVCKCCQSAFLNGINFKNYFCFISFFFSLVF